MIESFVDLTYRGLSLGRRIKLTQVRPSSGFLELAIPMPVGTHVAIATEEGVTFDATVNWVHEQVSGTERAPGMVVVPAIVADPASSWWKARVVLSDDDKPSLRPPRSRPATLRPHSYTEPAPPPDGAIAEEIPTALADLTVRVAMAAGVAPPAEVLAQLARSADGEPEAQRGEHPVVDDGQKTVMVAPITDDDPGANEDAGGSEGSESGEGGEGGEADEASDTIDTSAGDKSAAGRGAKKRRKRR